MKISPHYIDKINRKERGSRNYDQALIERDNYLRHELNKIDFASVGMVFVEDLKNIQRKTKTERRLNKSTRKILSTWVQGKTFRWLQHKWEKNCVCFIPVPAKYTSQTCSKCGHREKSNRNGENFNLLLVEPTARRGVRNVHLHLTQITTLPLRAVSSTSRKPKYSLCWIRGFRVSCPKSQLMDICP